MLLNVLSYIGCSAIVYLIFKLIGLFNIKYELDEDYGFYISGVRKTFRYIVIAVSFILFILMICMIVPYLMMLIGIFLDKRVHEITDERFELFKLEQKKIKRKIK